MKTLIITVGIIFAIIIGLVIVLNIKNNKTENTKSKKVETSSQNDVTFKAEDGYPISASYFPPNISNSPVIILIHQFGSDRSDYKNFIPVLIDEGYAVLAYDIRGFGKSRGGNADINNFPKDTIAAIEFLKNQKGVDKNRIGVIGASVGANVAFVTSGNGTDIKAAVALSPSNTGNRGVLMGNDVENFNPKNIFIASDENEKSDADFIFSISQNPKIQKTYPGFGHGISILKSPQAQKDILDFLSKNLKKTSN